MRRFKRVLLTSACLSMLGACVASVEDDPAEAVDEVESEIEVTEVQLCPSLVYRIPFSQDCTTPRGDGTRQCTDTITVHRFPVFLVGGTECRTTSTTSTRSCGFCIVIENPGDELPF